MRPRTVLCAIALVAVGCSNERAAAPSLPPSATPTTRPTAVASPSATSGATPRPTGVCRNSTSPACGAFRFDPEPDDEAVDVAVSYRPRTPKPREMVTFTLRASDPDSRHLELGTYEFTQRGPGKIGRDDFGSCPRAYGPWDPPARRSGSTTRTLTHVYREAGTFEATFTFFAHSYRRSSHPWDDDPPGDADAACIDPHASSGKADVVVRVG